MTKKCIWIFQFFGDEPRLGGDKPWSKNGDKCRMGGLTKFLLDGGPPRKKPCKYDDLQIALIWCHMKPSIVPISKPYEIDNIATQLGKAIKNISGDGDELYRGYGSNSLGLPLKVIDAVSGQTEFKYVFSSLCAYISILGTTCTIFACGFFFQWCVCTCITKLLKWKRKTHYTRRKKKTRQNSGLFKKGQVLCILERSQCGSYLYYKGSGSPRMMLKVIGNFFLKTSFWIKSWKSWFLLHDGLYHWKWHFVINLVSI